jgi:2-amino-4-hydroxy-6-hydroxymethyldihydropteridine diphosphokinase
LTLVPVCLGLGSNLADPLAQVRRALQALQQASGLHVRRASGWYRSVPMGPAEQPDYVNGVVAAETLLSAEALLDQLQRIECAMGRVRTDVRWGPRVIDLDLLLYGSQVIDSQRLQVPHPGIGERAFVLVPLAEVLDEDFVIPGQGRLGTLLRRVARSGLTPLPS